MPRPPWTQELNGVAGHDLALLDQAAARLASIENALDERQQALERSERRPSPSISGIREAGTLAFCVKCRLRCREEPEDALAETRIHHPRLVEAGTEEQSVDRLRQQLRDRRMTAFLEDPESQPRQHPFPARGLRGASFPGWLEGTESVDEIQDLVDRYRNAIAAPQTIGRREPFPTSPGCRIKTPGTSGSFYLYRLSIDQPQLGSLVEMLEDIDVGPALVSHSQGPGRAHPRHGPTRSCLRPGDRHAHEPRIRSAAPNLGPRTGSPVGTGRSTG